jgi:hypothetical protein
MQRISTRPMKKVVLAGILVVIGVLAFGFAPLVPWSDPELRVRIIWQGKFHLLGICSSAALNSG